MMNIKKILRNWVVAALSEPKSIAKVNISQVCECERFKGHTVVVTGGSKGIGYSIAKKLISEDSQQTFEWDFKSYDMCMVIFDMMIHDLREKKFYVQMMNINDGLTTARKGDINFSVRVEGSTLVISAAEKDMGLFKEELIFIVERVSQSTTVISSLKDAILSNQFINK